MTIYLIAGTNGCGKSTFLVDFIRMNQLTSVEYVCQGFHNANLISKTQIESGKTENFHLYKMDRLLHEQKSMILEHALADREIINFLDEARGKGYRIVSVFIKTASPLINLRRVAKRISEGGHGVATPMIIRRYYRALGNLSALKKVSDELYIYDNSKTLTLKKSYIDGYVFDHQ